MAAESICSVPKNASKLTMDDVEGSQRVIADDLSEAFNVQQTGA